MAELPPDFHVLLGTLPDSKLAKQAGVPPRVVFRARRALGIKSFGGTRRPQWQPPDDFAAVVAGAPTLTAAAQQLGASAGTVVTYIHVLHVPLPPQWAAPMPRPPRLPNPSWLASIQARLGVVPDAELAAEVGRSRERIRQVRQRLGIPVRGRGTSGQEP